MKNALAEAMKQFEALGSERMRAQNRRHGAGENQFGVRLGDVRKLAAKIRADHALPHGPRVPDAASAEGPP